MLGFSLPSFFRKAITWQSYRIITDPRGYVPTTQIPKWEKAFLRSLWQEVMRLFSFLSTSLHWASTYALFSVKNNLFYKVFPSSFFSSIYTAFTELIIFNYSYYMCLLLLHDKLSRIKITPYYFVYLTQC